jgi:hypothetical protein
LHRYRSFLDLYWSVVVLALGLLGSLPTATAKELSRTNEVLLLVSLHRATTHSLAPPGLIRNRQRIWDFAGLLIEIARQEPGVTMQMIISMYIPGRLAA